VAFGFDLVPGVLDLAIRADQECAADDAHERAPHEFFHPPGAESFEHLVCGVAQQRKIELLLHLENGQRFFGIGACAENLHAQLVEVLLCVTKLGRLDRSTGSVGLWEEEQNGALALQVL